MMKPTNQPRFNFKAMLLLSALTIQSHTAQMNSSVSYDNFVGASSLISNPANIAYSKFEWNVGTNYFQYGFTDYGELPLFEFSGVPNGFNIMNYEGNTRLEDNPNFISVENNRETDFSITGLIKLFPKHSVGFAVRARTFGNFKNVNGPLWQKTSEQYGSNLDLESQFIIQDFDLNNPGIIIHEQSWKEFGATYAGVVYESEKFMVAAGGTFKYLMGVGAMQLTGDLQGAYALTDAAGNLVDQLTLDSGSNIQYVNTFTDVQQGADGITGYGFFDSASDFDSKGTGIGADLGTVIELRTKFTNRKTFDINPQAINKYKLRLGISVLDIGSIDYDDEAITQSYQVTRNFNTAGRELGDLGLLEILRQQSDDVTTGNNPGQLTFKLPTSINVNADYLISNSHNWFINFNYSGPLGGYYENFQNTRMDTFSLTPRFEKSQYAFYVPVSYQENLQLGLGARYGPVSLGLNTLFSIGESVYNPNGVFISVNALKLEELFK